MDFPPDRILTKRFPGPDPERGPPRELNAKKRIIGHQRGRIACAYSPPLAPGNLPREVPAEALAAVLISIVPGYILQLATLGSAPIEGVPAAVKALWP